jgi:hypothetical protein
MEFARSGMSFRHAVCHLDPVGVCLGTPPPPIQQECFKLLLTVVLTLAATVPAAAQSLPDAGQIKVVSGRAFVVRQDQMIPAKVGLHVYEADVLRTGPDGRLGVTLRDDTRLALGPSSEASLDRFLYSPADGRFGFALKVLRGIASYASGRIARLAPDAVRLETPDAIVGVRGTKLAIGVWQD